MEWSCNTTFAQLAIEVGAEAMYKQAEAFGFNDHYLDDLGPQAESVYPAGTNKPQTGQSGFGQFDVRATPLQMAMVAAGIANGGTVMKPYIVDEVQSADLDILDKTDPSELSRAVSPTTANELTKLMVATVNEGTASPGAMEGIEVAGKTGTAQSGVDGQAAVRLVRPLRTRRRPAGRGGGDDRERAGAGHRRDRRRSARRSDRQGRDGGSHPMSSTGPSSGHGNPGPTLIGGRYELGELLGRGGMAEVRKGTDTRLGRVVAVKRLRTDLASDATFQARFRREAQSSASLNHPSIVSVYDTGEELATDGSGINQPYIVMEYVAGRTLRDILREGRKILPERALEITSGVLSALDYSHRAGIIHRDIKPGNVMLTPSGDVKVMDFGIARAISDASSTMTQTAAVVGTAQYLSPEQARGETVDSRSDVYSAGCLLYELLTGRPPFVGDSPVAVAYQHVREPAVPPSDHDTSLTPEIDTIVMKSLAKRVEDRYQSAAAMRADIERYLAGHPVRATAPPLPSEPQTTVAPTYAQEPSTQSTITTPAVPPEADDDRGGNRTGLIVFLGVLLVALIVGAALSCSRPCSRTRPNRSRCPT